MLIDDEPNVLSSLQRLLRDRAREVDHPARVAPLRVHDAAVAVVGRLADEDMVRLGRAIVVFFGLAGS